MLKRNRKPTIPGKILKELYMKSHDVSNKLLAEALRCSAKHVSNLIRGKVRIEAEMATRLAAVFGTTPELWLGLQNDVDVYEARESMRHWRPAHVFHASFQPTI